MFVSRLNTYITRNRNMLTQQHVCAASDKNAARALTAEDMAKKGYALQKMGENLFVFSHPEKGYLCLHPDMSLHHHTETLNKNSYVRVIDPSILPPAPFIKPEARISKYIHQTGYKDKLPDDFVNNRDTLILLNPDYKYTYWHDGGGNTCSALIKKYYGDEVLRYYEAINPRYGAAKGDLFRYLCIYALGGVYLDLKSTVVVPLDKIIHSDDEYLLSFWPWVGSVYDDIKHIKYGSEYEQFFIMAAAGHPLMHRVVHQTLCNIKLYDPSFHGVGFDATFSTTGPIMYSRIIDTFRSLKTTRLFHARSSGVEYSIFGHEEHREKLGSSYYAKQTSPLIINNDSL